MLDISFFILGCVSLLLSFELHCENICTVVCHRRVVTCPLTDIPQFCGTCEFNSVPLKPSASLSSSVVCFKIRNQFLRQIITCQLDKTKCQPGKTRLLTSNFIFYTKIALRPVSYAAKLLMAKKLILKILQFPGDLVVKNFSIVTAVVRVHYLAWELLPVPPEKNIGHASHIFLLLFLILHNDFYFFSIIAGLQCSVNFLLYSKVTQLHIHVYILLSQIIMLHHK